MLRRVCEARAAYNELGNTVVDDAGVRCVRNQELPNVHDANCVSRARTGAELARVDEFYGDLHFRKVMVDPDTPPAFEASLVLNGYEPRHHIELVLGDVLRASPGAFDLRLVESEDDWRSLTELWQLNHDEEVEKGQHDDWGAGVTEQMVRAKQFKAPDLRFWLARVDGVDAGFFSSWCAPNGIGIVEDLFTRPEFRHRGIATALIAHCVTDARERGAGPVAISARLEDTPKHMYAALGFHPTGISRSYVKTF